MSPIYNFYCEKCKSSQDEMFSIKNRPDFITCTTCNGSAAYQIAGGSFVINGANAANKYSGDSNYKWVGDDS